MIDKIIDTATDGEVIDTFKNYKKGKQVTVPTSFQARPNSTPVKLAYITDDEAGILKILKPDVPHDGPMNIPNYNDYDPDRGFTSGTAMSSAETGGKSATDRANISAEFGPKGLAPGVTPNEVRDLRSSYIAAGAGQRVNPGFFDSRDVISPYELKLAKAFNPTAFKANRRGGIMDFFTSGGILGNLVRGLGQRLGLGKTFDQPTYDMSEFSRLGLDGVVPGTYDFNPDAKINKELTEAELNAYSRFGNIGTPKTFNRMFNINDIKSLIEAAQKPQGMDFAAARRAMTQPTTYRNVPFEGARTFDTYKNVDPYKMNYLTREFPNYYRSESLLNREQPKDGIMTIDLTGNESA
jgi:hypothetical protein